MNLWMRCSNVVTGAKIGSANFHAGERMRAMGISSSPETYLWSRFRNTCGNIEPPNSEASYFFAPTSSAMRFFRSRTYSVFSTSEGAVQAM